MPEQIFSKIRVNGIADYAKQIPMTSLTGEAQATLADAVAWTRSVDYRTDPMAVTLLPAAVKESGSTVTDLLLWADTTPDNLDVYAYGNTGNFYKRTTAGSWSLLSQIPSSHGNGLAYYYGDKYVYFSSDATLGRYGPTDGTPQLTTNFLKSAGGVPTNTNSLSLVVASTMYGHAANASTLDITGNLTLETFFKATSLPAVGSSMTLLGKWDESA